MLPVGLDSVAWNNPLDCLVPVPPNGRNRGVVTEDVDDAESVPADVLAAKGKSRGEAAPGMDSVRLAPAAANGRKRGSGAGAAGGTGSARAAGAPLAGAGSANRVSPGIPKRPGASPAAGDESPVDAEIPVKPSNPVKVGRPEVDPLAVGEPRLAVAAVEGPLRPPEKRGKAADPKPLMLPVSSFAPAEDGPPRRPNIRPSKIPRVAEAGAVDKRPISVISAEDFIVERNRHGQASTCWWFFWDQLGLVRERIGHDKLVRDQHLVDYVDLDL